MFRLSVLARTAPRTVAQPPLRGYTRLGASERGPGAEFVFVIRHGERLDRPNPGWSKIALRPQDTPLSQRGVAQARRLGKWLYGRLPVSQPLAIFASPFIRCVQTADAIAEQLEGLQREGLHAASATKICIEPGLVCASPRVDLKYKPLRHVTHARDEDGQVVETTPGGTLARCNTIALELADHPLVRQKGTALLVTHGCPSTHMVRSLNPAPGGILLPSYHDIEAGHYDGPPLQYTACTAMKRDFDSNSWDLAPGYQLFSNEHDPRLAHKLRNKADKVTRYVFPHGYEPTSLDFADMDEVEIPQDQLEQAKAGDVVFVECRHIHGPLLPDALQVRIPNEFRLGDIVKVRLPPSKFGVTTRNLGTPPADTLPQDADEFDLDESDAQHV